jgi:hypothetical protein
MFRVLGTFGLGILFVVISPPLRLSLINDADALQTKIVANSPWSYIAISAGILALLLFGLYRSAQPRT